MITTHYLNPRRAYILTPFLAEFHALNPALEKALKDVEVDLMLDNAPPDPYTIKQSVERAHLVLVDFTQGTRAYIPVVHNYRQHITHTPVLIIGQHRENIPEIAWYLGFVQYDYTKPEDTIQRLVGAVISRITSDRPPQ